MILSKSRVFSSFASTVLALSTPVASAGCGRAFLSELTTRYIAAQSVGQPLYINNLVPPTQYIENNKTVDILTGILSKPLKIDHSRSIHDTAECSAYTELIVSDPANPHVIGTQIFLGLGGVAIDRIESIITGPDDWLFNAQHTLHYALTESWEPIPLGKRDNRTTIKAAADAYLDLFRKGNGSVPVPWAPDCKRLEGGLYTAEGDTCNDGVPSGVDLVNRRYVIDEQAGSADVFLTFGGGKNGSALPDSHQFRVESGKIRFVHTITKCFEKNCGFKAPDILKDEVGY